ncbi:accessory gene regulator B family protein [Paenibacillus helianthi]|uniref:accessory gene regulator B family protein n=1 Tax=Paenibacillus helianthi TaxID=1349432 RepID=UPI003CC62726
MKRANPEETCSIEVMQYALNILLNTFFTFIATLIIGWTLNNLTDTLIFYISFSLLRVCSGGKHLKTAAACNIVTFLSCSLIPYFLSFPGNYLWIINAVCLIIMIFFAPNPDQNAQIPLRWFPALKLISMGLVGCNFFINSSVIGLAFLLQSLTVISRKGRGEL